MKKTDGEQTLNSAIYRGWVRHRRYQPKQHHFRYRVFMMYLDLAELDQVFNGTRLWSVEGPGLAQFKRADFLGDPAIALDEAVRLRVQQETGVYPDGPVRMLANLRYFGFIMNPITCYYCFDQAEQLQFIVAEVNNTPWDERCSYVLQCDPNTRYQRIHFGKAMHVSPFNPMAIEYDWRSSLPEQNLRIHMQNWRQQAIEFDATLVLEREPLTAGNLRRILWQYPLMTVKVVTGIYWQALKLFVKGVPVHDHPDNTVKVND